MMDLYLELQLYLSARLRVELPVWARLLCFFAAAEMFNEGNTNNDKLSRLSSLDSQGWDGSTLEVGGRRARQNLTKNNESTP
jgi:hypothetical protein